MKEIVNNFSENISEKVSEKSTDKNDMKRFKLASKRFVGVAAFAVALTLLSGCGAKNVSQTGENIVPTEKNESQTEGEYTPNYDVKLDERSEGQKHSYAEDDLCFVDTLSGQKIVLGMTADEVESITGEPVRNDGSYKVYDGVIVQYKDDKAVTFIVSGGEFKDSSANRYKTTRGIGIGTSREDFGKAYGDEAIAGSTETGEDGEVEKNPSMAKRYFKKDGDKIKYLGDILDDKQKQEQKEAEKSDNGTEYYMQDFMFSDSDTVVTLRVSLTSAVKGGL